MNKNTFIFKPLNYFMSWENKEKLKFREDVRFRFNSKQKLFLNYIEQLLVKLNCNVHSFSKKFDFNKGTNLIILSEHP